MDAGANQAVPFYASAKVLFVLAVLGAWGAIDAALKAYKYVPRAYRWLHWRWYNRQIDKDFYFKYREAAYRIAPGKTQFLYVRKETVVALQELKEIPVSYRWTGDGKITEQVLPGNLHLTDAQRVKGQINTRKRIQVNDGLAKGEEITYTFVVRCQAGTKEPEPFLGSESSHRVDRLVLRAVFPVGEQPGTVYCVEHNADKIEIRRSQIEEYDYINGEYRVEIFQPRAHITYSIEWEYK